MTPLRVYCAFRALPDECLPAVVVRRPGKVLIAVDLRSSRLQVVDWINCNTTVEERNVIREGYGEPPVGQPLSPIWLLDEPMPRYIPEALRVPGDPSYLCGWSSQEPKLLLVSGGGRD